MSTILAGRRFPWPSVEKLLMRPRWRKVFTDLTGGGDRSWCGFDCSGSGGSGMIVILFHTIGDDMREGYAAVHPANIRTNQCCR
jgi:hypothetical protein